MSDADVPKSLKALRVALVHDYLNQAGGAEKVVETFCEMFPGAPVYTSVYDGERMPDFWRDVDIRTSFLQRVTPKARFARALAPLYPMAFESFDLTEYDLVISSTTTFAKGIVTRPETCHVCYCNNPTRSLWMYHDYFRYERLLPGSRAPLAVLATGLRLWDYAAAQRVDYFVAGSTNAGRRIRKYYRRESDVVHAPIDVASFQIADERDDYFLVVARLQPYKRIDLAIEACNQLKLPLHVIGDGPDAARLRHLAGPTVTFAGRVSDAEVRQQMSRCRALIWPGEEDFGLVPLEAQASGRPVIAYAAGGALETIKDGETGIFFQSQTVAAVAGAIASFEDTYDPGSLRAHTLPFDKVVFKKRIYDVLTQRYGEHRARLAG